MNGADNNDVVVDATAVGDLKIADLIVDYAPQAEAVDLTGLVGSLLDGSAGQPGTQPGAAPAQEAVIAATQAVATPGESALELAGLSGIGHTITILYDETPTI